MKRRAKFALAATLTMNPAFGTVHLHLGRVFWAMGRFEEALDALQQAPADLPMARGLLVPCSVGSVVARRPATFSLSCRPSRPSPVSGRCPSPSCTRVWETWIAVRTLADEFLAPLNNGSFTAESTMSIADFWDRRYFPHVQAQKSPSTVNGYRNMWSRYLKGHMTMAIRDFRTVDCQRVLEAVVVEHDVSNTTARHIKHLLGGLFRYAIQVGVLNGVNPVQAASIPKAKSGRRTYAYTLDQILKMLEILPQPARAIVAVAGFAGLRKGEIRGLRPEDYDGSTLNIERAAWRGHIAKPKGKRGAGVVPLIPTAAAVLDEHLEGTTVRNFIFETLDGRPGALDYVGSRRDPSGPGRSRNPLVRSTRLPARPGHQSPRARHQRHRDSGNPPA